MSESANAQTIRRLYAAMGKPTLDETLALLTEDIEFVVPGPAGLGAAGTWQGADGVRECLRRLRQGQETQSLQFLDFVSEGSNVVVRLRVRGRVLATGKGYDSEIIHFFTLRDGKVARLVDFFDTAALAEAFSGPAR